MQFDARLGGEAAALARDHAEVLRRLPATAHASILAQMQKESSTPVEIVDNDVPDVGEVDAKLVALAPARSQGYGVIVGLTALAMVAGIVLICLELNEYDWQFEAKTTPAQRVERIPAEVPVGKPAPAPVNPMGDGK